MNTVTERIEKVHVIEPVTAGGLQMFGLRRDDESNLAYTTLDEALDAETIEVTEASDRGRIPTLLVVNKGNDRVLLVAGEQLIGAKQNRVLNVTIMIDGKSKSPIPVSCVEQGRWRYYSRKFRSGGTSSPSRLRAKMSKHATEGYLRDGTPSSRQEEVWDEVSCTMCCMACESPTSALEQVYEDYRPKLDEVVRQARIPEDCCGVVFAFGGKIVGLDLFDKPGTLSKLLPKLVRANAVNAMETSDGGARVDRDRVVDWLRSIASASCQQFKSPGLGDDVRIESDDVVGAALVVEGEPVHIESFAV